MGAARTFGRTTATGSRAVIPSLPWWIARPNFILGWTLAESENARATQALIKRVCQTWGIFDRLYTDNGRSFTSHLVAGGTVKKFRNSGNKMKGVKPLGICHHLGIAVHYATPRNGQTKTAERTFASLSRVLDDRPEYKGAHAGHEPGTSPNSCVVPVPFETASTVCTREVARHNAEAGRRGQGMKGRSYQAAFEAGLANRVKRTATARQLYHSGLISTPVKVNRWGQVDIDTWTYGAPDTQSVLRPYHAKGEAILLGRDPDDFAAPALAWNEKNS
jgi:putative transposase